MARPTLFIGIILVVLGIAGFLITGRQHVTALIPTFLGCPILLLGWLGLKSQKEKLLSLIAAIISLIGLGGSMPGLIKLPSLLSGADVARPAAIYLQSIMAVLCIIYLAFYLRYRFAKRTE